MTAATKRAALLHSGDRIVINRLGTPTAVRVTGVANAGVVLIVAWRAIGDGFSGSNSFRFESDVELAR